VTAHTHVVDMTCTEVGPSVCLRPFDHVTEDGSHPGGFLFFHDTKSDEDRCTGTIVTCPCEGQYAWIQEGSLKRGTLTITPSVECTFHGFHGWITDGAWSDVT
jgi:hypothetical protein